MDIPAIELDRIVDAALAEDLGWGDITTDAFVPPHVKGKGSFLVKARGVLAGMEVAQRVFHRVDRSLVLKITVPDGSRVDRGMVVGAIEGPLNSILKGERTALNFLQRMSGIATGTAQLIDAVSGLPTKIMDTRKTVPGLRFLDKYAVRIGGGKNHRFHLGDGILVKDNHWEALKVSGETLAQAIQRVKARASIFLRVEVEVKNMEEALESVAAGADILLLDNMTPEEMRRVVQEVKGKVLTEASGSVNLQNVRAVAESGVDFISSGALTHSVKTLDISLEVGMA
ncbi:MAG: carboxylating nicotinate-nucleotide diphosphorylase [Chloroflexi bacterium]|nr:carboxylating nicotinate-nucleotide diphosphorylase [Chloroflexota bacterium]